MQQPQQRGARESSVLLLRLRSSCACVVVVVIDLRPCAWHVVLRWCLQPRSAPIVSEARCSHPVSSAALAAPRSRRRSSSSTLVLRRGCASAHGHLSPGGSGSSIRHSLGRRHNRNRERDRALVSRMPKANASLPGEKPSAFAVPRIPLTIIRTLRYALYRRTDMNCMRNVIRSNWR
jgi:hypothetical protein